jgi:hypothetical protein
MTVIEREWDQDSRISWKAVFAGAVVALAIGAMLTLLGVALGAAALDPYDMSRGEAKGLAAAAGLWLAVSSAVGLFCGAWLAARVDRDWDLRNDAFQSIAVWAVAFLMALVIAALSGTGFLGPLVRGAAVSPAMMAESMDSALIVPPGAPNAAALAASPDAAAAIDHARRATAGAAGWAFFYMLLGLLAALAGGWVAARGVGLRVHIKRTDRRTDEDRVYTTSSADPQI